MAGNRKKSINKGKRATVAHNQQTTLGDTTMADKQDFVYSLFIGGVTPEEMANIIADIELAIEKVTTDFEINEN